MADLLVVAERVRNGVRDTTLDAIDAAAHARPAGGRIVVVVIDSEPETLLPAVSLEGVDEIVSVPSPVSTFEPEVIVTALEAILTAREPLVTLMGQSVNAAAVGARVAALRGLGFASNVISLSSIDGRIRARREILGGKVETELEFAASPFLLIAASGDGANLGPSPVPVTTHDLALTVPERSSHVGFEPPSQGEVDLSRANLIIAIGRGIGDRESVALFEELAGKAGGVLGSSRPIVDGGWLSRSHQVGQSGTTVKPSVYVAFGISGAAEHLAGMKDSGTVIAVNTDPRARIFDVADVGALADACDVAEALLEEL
jgi:electron transfer flavoprotein alpha subunit